MADPLLTNAPPQQDNPVCEAAPTPTPTPPTTSQYNRGAEVSLNADEILALFPLCLLKITSLEFSLSANKQLLKDTVHLLHKRIKKVEVRFKIIPKRKMVVSESEDEEEAMDNAALDSLLTLADAPNPFSPPFVTPFKHTYDISPTALEAAEILRKGKLDPSKISKYPKAVEQRSVQAFTRKRRRSSSTVQHLDFSSVAFTFVPADSSVPAASVPADGLFLLNSPFLLKCLFLLLNLFLLYQRIWGKGLLWKLIFLPDPSLPKSLSKKDCEC